MTTNPKNRSPMLPLMLLAALLGTGCAQTGHATEASPLGAGEASWGELLAELETPGAITVEKVTVADWAVDRAGLINLEHEHAVEAGLEDGKEPIEVYVYVVRHPVEGTFLIDTGVERAVAERDEDMRLSAIFAAAMNLEALDVHEDTASLVERVGPLAGVFLTHLHFDHMGGLPDVPAEVPIYTGPGEAADDRFVNAFTQGMVDEILEGRAPLREWQLETADAGPFAGLVDIFGDGSLWGLHVPGHTDGSMAFLARTPEGPVLIAGDASHTVWGWEHDVEPGEFSSDLPRSVDSLAALKDLAARMPDGAVHVGHQSLQTPPQRSQVRKTPKLRVAAPKGPPAPVTAA